MPERPDQPGPAKPLRTWRPMALWTAAILAALGLAWFTGAVALPLYQVHAAARRCAQHEGGKGEGIEISFSAIEELGGETQAAARLRVYLRLPRWVAKHKDGAMVMLGSCGRPAVPALIEVLRDPDRSLHSSAANSLGLMGIEAPEAVPALVEALTEPHDNARAGAAWALGEIRTEPDKAVPALARALGDKYWPVCSNAASALGKYGQAARGAIPALTTALGDERHEVRASAAEALKQIRSEKK